MPRFFAAKSWNGAVGSAAVVAATPTLAVADNADGTGGVATITNADAAGAVVVYSQSVDGELGTTTWTSRGSRTGNGTVAVAPGNGFYWWHAKSTLSGDVAVSNFVYQNLTDGTTAVHYRCLTGVQSRIQTLSLTGITNANIVVKKLPLERLKEIGAISYPAVLITPQRETMNPKEGTTARDDVGYGVIVTMLAADNQEPTLAENLPRNTLWRHRIAKAFRNQRLPGVAESLQCFVEPMDFIVPEAWGKNIYASALLIRCMTRELRGV